MLNNSDKNSDTRLQNLRPFKPRQSGNPSGRPKGQRNYATIYREALEKVAHNKHVGAEDMEVELLSKAITFARKGNYQFYKDIMDRLYGRAGATGVETSDPRPYDNLSDEELEQRMEKGMRDLGYRVEKIV